VIVTPNTVNNAAQNFGTGQEDLADAWMHLQAALDTAAGMAGNDKVADRFNAKYSAAVTVAWKAFDKSITTLGGTSLGLTATANNYVRADHYSRADRPPGAPAVFTPQRVLPAMSAALPPSVIGAPDEGFGFGWEGFYSTLLAGYWPPAHIDRLRAAAKAWRAAAAEVDKVAGWLDWTISGLIDINEGPAVTAIRGFWSKVHTTGDPHTVLGGLSQLCTALGTACDQFATLTDKVRQKMINRVGQVEAELSLTVGTSAIISRALGGILGSVTDTALAAVTIVVGRVLTDDMVTTVDAAIAATPTINAVEADFEAVSGTALEDEMAAAEGKTISQLSGLRGNLEGKTNVVVDDPADPGRTITDIDDVQDGILWEDKSATDAQDVDKWISKHIYKKFSSYLDARQYLPGYENAPIGFRFTEPGMTSEFRTAIQSAIQELRADNPGVDIRLDLP
jgi:hypothetical protein